MDKPDVLLSILPLTWPNMPPIGLGYLQAFLAQKAIHVDIIDFNNIFYNRADEQLKKDWVVSCSTFLEENILTIIERDYFEEYCSALKMMLQYEIVGFSCFKSNFITTLRVATHLKSKKKSIRTILGGPEITRLYFKTGGTFDSEIISAADFFIAGEGELPLFHYLTNKNNGKKTVSFEQLSDLAELPFPRYTGIDLTSYGKKYSLPIQFSRGCIRRCNFCAERLLYKGIRTRNVSSLIAEMHYHKTRNKTKYFVFYDSMINANLKKLEELCDGIIGHFGSISWEAQIGIRNDMNLELFEKIKQSGCYSLFVGMESASDSVLKKMNKGFTPEDALQFFELLHQAGIFFGVSIIVGYPGETEQDFHNTLDFIIRYKKIIPQIAQINPFTYYDGTSAEKEADYKTNPIALERMKIMTETVKRNKMRYTNAFVGNLIEKNVRG